MLRLLLHLPPAVSLTSEVNPRDFPRHGLERAFYYFRLCHKQEGQRLHSSRRHIFGLAYMIFKKTGTNLWKLADFLIFETKIIRRSGKSRYIFSWVNNWTTAIRRGSLKLQLGTIMLLSLVSAIWIAPGSKKGGQNLHSQACYLVGFQNEAHWADWAKALEQPPQSPEVTVFAKRPSIDCWYLHPLDPHLREKQQDTVI